MTIIVPRNWCLIFFRDPDAQFDSARLNAVLSGAGIPFSDEGKSLTVQVGDGQKMRLSFARGKVIETVLRGLVASQRKFKDLVKGCDAQIKIEIENLDEALDEMNTLIEIQASLQAACHGLMYNGWNQEFSAPGSE